MIITPDISRLFHHRWTIPLIAELARRDGERFVTLAHSLRASPTVLRQTLEAAVASGWVMSNPGYGHPLRPEYILTDTGRRLSLPCLTLDEALRGRSERDIALRKWSVPLLLAFQDEALRFSEMRNRLPGVTDRALSRAVADLRAVRWISRHVSLTPRLTVWYGTTRRARPYLEISRALMTKLAD